MSKYKYGLEIKISAGLKHGVAVSDTGVLYSWGSNSYGQLASNENS
jgi:alpha-tubulin suppressor-like RCC1 family protein